MGPLEEHPRDELESPFRLLDIDRPARCARVYETPERTLLRSFEFPAPQEAVLSSPMRTVRSAASRSYSSSGQ